MFDFKKLRKRWQPLGAFPDSWLKWIKQNVPYHRRLPPGKQRNLQDKIQRFIAEKYFEGCGGLTLTDEITVTIAAQACILVLGNDRKPYPDLRAILVYPNNYFASVKQTSQDGVITEGFQQRLGESWSYGNVVLAWNDALAGASNEQDGKNLVFHEFAHQIDGEFGITKQLQSHPANNDDEFIRVLRKSNQTFLNALETGCSTLIDPYGATNPAEFFAVVTETFFEQPAALRRKYPKLYEQFCLFYGQNPIEYFQG